MRVLVTGAGGQLGRALQTTAPPDVVVLGVTHAELDITDAEAVKRLVTNAAPDLIVNAAAYTAVDRAESERATAFRINRDGTGIVADAARMAGAHLVHVSTDFVFDGRGAAPIGPDAPRAPLNVYGASKAEGEDAVYRSRANALVLRTAWVYAATGRNFVATVLRLAAEGKPLRIVDDQLGTPTSAISLAHAIWSLGVRRTEGVLHFTNSGVASWYDFAVAVIDCAHAAGLLPRPVAVEPIPSRAYPTAAARPDNAVLDKSATWALLGQPADHWQHELARVIATIAGTQAHDAVRAPTGIDPAGIVRT